MQDFQKGVHGTECREWVWEGGSSENKPVLKIVLVMTWQHKYVQLSGNNHALLICSRIGVVMTLVFELWHSIIVVRCKHASF